MSSDPYDVLGVARDVGLEELKTAYRRLVRENHPDVASDKEAATARMASINQAWRLIGDPQKRLAFDAHQRLQAFERQHQPHASAAPRPHADRPMGERERLEVQRRARLEREQIERERARRLRNAAKSPRSAKAKPSAPASGAAPAASSHSAKVAAKGTGKGISKLASKPASKASERQGAASREMRLRHKITLAAQLFHRERKADEAIALCRGVLQVDGRSVPARELLGDIYLQQGRVEYALMMFDQALLIAPDNLMLRRKRDGLQRAQERPKPASNPTQAPRGSLFGRLRARLTIKK